MKKLKMQIFHLTLRCIRQFEILLSRLREMILHTADLGPEEKEVVLNKKIEDFFEKGSLANKRYTFLESAKLLGIVTVRDLTQASKSELMKYGKTIQRVEDKLAAYGLSIEKP